MATGNEEPYGNHLVDMLPHGERGGQPTMDGMLLVAWPNNSTITPSEVLETKAPALPDQGTVDRQRRRRPA